MITVVAVVAVGAVGIAVLVLDRGSSQSSASTPAPTGAVLASPELADTFRSAAASDIAAVTNYDYRRLEDALTSGLAVSTGSYRESYRKAFLGDLGASARRNRLVQNFELQRTGIAGITDGGRSAEILIFGVERLASGPDSKRKTRVREVSAVLTLVRRGDRFLISRLVDGGQTGLPAGSAALVAAARTARRQMINLFSFRHDAFDADYARALASAREPLRTLIRDNAVATRRSLTETSSDLVGAVQAVGVEQAAVNTVDLLVTVRIVRVGEDGTRSDPSVGRFTVTVVRSGDRWYTTVVDQVETS